MNKDRLLIFLGWFSVNAALLAACFVPMFGHFGSYQAVNAMMAEMFGAVSGASFFEPRTFSIMAGEPSLHLLYYPFVSFFAKLVQMVLGLPVETIPFLGRVQGLLFLNVSVWLVYMIAGYFTEEFKHRLLPVILVFTSPMLLIESAAFRNEAFAFLMSTLALWATLKSSEDRGFLWLAGLCFGISVVTRIHFASFAIAHAYFLVTRSHWRIEALIKFGLAGLVPIVVWLVYFYNLSEVGGLAVQTSIFGQSGEGRLLQIEFIMSEAFMQRFMKQLIFYVMNPLGWLVVLVGTFHLFNKKYRGLWVLVLASLPVVFLLPTKVYDHPFYLLPMVLPMALLSIGVSKTFFDMKGFLLCAFIVMVVGVLFIVKNPLFWVPDETQLWLEQAKQVEAYTEPEDWVIVEHEQTAGMLYYAHRRGWVYDLKMDEKDPADMNQVRQQRRVKDGYGDHERWFKYLLSQGADYFYTQNIALLKEKPILYNALQKYPQTSLKEGAALFNLK